MQPCNEYKYRRQLRVPQNATEGPSFQHTVKGDQPPALSHRQDSKARPAEHAGRRWRIPENGSGSWRSALEGKDELRSFRQRFALGNKERKVLASCCCLHALRAQHSRRLRPSHRVSIPPSHKGFIRFIKPFSIWALL
jgi:hypothetical protein